MKKIPYGKFKGYLAENGIKQSEVAKLLEITESTLSKKLNRKRNADFSKDEVVTLCRTYGLDANLFFLEI